MKVYISLLIIIQILSNYTIWDGLSQKTISRYCPFNPKPESALSPKSGTLDLASAETQTSIRLASHLVSVPIS